MNNDVTGTITVKIDFVFEKFMKFYVGYEIFKFSIIFNIFDELINHKIEINQIPLGFIYHHKYTFN